MRIGVLSIIATGTLLTACDGPTKSEFAAPPELHIDAPSEYWHGKSWTILTTKTGQVYIAGNASADRGLANVSYRLDGGSRVPMELNRLDRYSARFSEAIPVSDGIYPLVVTAMDMRGNESEPVEFTVRATSASIQPVAWVTMEGWEGEYGEFTAVAVRGTTEGIEDLWYELGSWVYRTIDTQYTGPLEMTADGSFEAELDVDASFWNHIAVAGVDSIGVPVKEGWRYYQLSWLVPTIQISPAPTQRVVNPETGRIDLSLMIDVREGEIDSLAVQIDDDEWEPIAIPAGRSSVEVPWSPTLTSDTSELAVRAVSARRDARILRFAVPAS